MTAVRVELGYATNIDDSAVLSTSVGRDQLAAALADSLLRLLTPRIG
jgi:N-acetylmuramoyl-L-alanine amidase